MKSLAPLVLAVALACAFVPALTAVGCAGCQTTVQPPQPSVDAGTGAVDAASPVDECTVDRDDDCGRAGERLCRMQCTGRDGAPLWRTPANRRFSEVCREAAQDCALNGDCRDWRADCLARITSCSQVSTAYRTPKGSQCPQ